MAMSQSKSGADEVHAAARTLYQAELALHDAHASGVDAWVAAAADGLHRAVERYLALTSPSAAAAA